ncbi:MAG: glycerophosphodiester phosphodiesterase [Alphaproteobacteria bacterium]|nr:glycerophosphodiester phosphodiesterase [Alphaproteobacteria bacterium]
MGSVGAALSAIAAAVLAALLLLAASPAAGLEIIGAKGARGLAPENTLDGFAAALGVGVDRIQIDVVSSRDGVLVAHEGPRLNPDIARRRATRQWLTAPTPLLKDYAYQDLWQFDVGRLEPTSRLARLYPDQEPAEGVSIPSLAEVFNLVRRAHAPEVRFMIEPRLTPRERALTPNPRAFAELLAREIGALRLAPRVIVASLDWTVPRVLQTALPGIEVALMTSEQPFLNTLERGRAGPSPWLAGFDADDFPTVPAMVMAAGAQAWAPNALDASDAAVRNAKALGLKVFVWTVNDPQAMERFFDLGIDGIVTDYPDRLRKVLQKRGHALPRRHAVKP